MTESKIQEILDVKDSQTIQKFLRNIKPFQKISPDNNIPFVMLEKLAKQYCRTYNGGIQYIHVDYRCEGVWFAKADWNYSAEIVRICYWKKLATIKAETMYELFAKICIAFYLFTKNGFMDRKGTEDPVYGKMS